MSLLRTNRQGVGRLLKPDLHPWLSLCRPLIRRLSCIFACPSFLKFRHPNPKLNQLPSAPVDPLGRQTPRSSLIGFLKYDAIGDYATAARFLQLPPGEHPNLAELAKEMRAIYPDFQGSINLLSDDPGGTVEAGLPPGQVRAGVVTVGGKTADVILVRVDDPAAGKIWLISQATLAAVPALYAELERETQTETSRIRLALLSGPMLLGMSSTQWLFWLLSIPISWLLAWLLTFLLSAPRRAWCKLRKLRFTHSLGYATWHAAPVHDCDRAARLFCVPAAAAAFVSHLLCSCPGSHPGGMFWLAREQAL